MSAFHGCPIYRIEDAAKRFSKRGIREAQHQKPLMLEKSRPHSVTNDIQIIEVLASVEFDDKL